ncbi:MAG: response regulator [Acidobacteriaceae bacterium]|nr:response regulator [Acidobacteriaceae bacterium]
MARKVLLADDSVTAQNMGRRILVDAGYEVVTVNNGSSALKKVTESKPDLIVLDVYMPGYGGLEVCQRIREAQETARIPILLTVGKLEPFKADEARRVRADAFIVKPFEASELLTALAKLEDKIVPQPSGRKSGRKNFADEEPGVSKAFGDVESGWKNRLKIPPPHHSRTQDRAASASSETQPALEEEPKTVVEQPSASNDFVAENAPAPVAEAVPPSKEVAHAVQSPESSIGDAQITSEPPVRVPEPVAERPQDAIPTNPDEAGKPTEAIQAAAIDSPSTSKSHEEEVAAALASLAPTNGHSSSSSAEVPVTMAAAVAVETYSGPRWIAAQVALSDDESSLILDQEMQKAFAAFAAADAARMSSSCEYGAAEAAELPQSPVAIEAEPKEDTPTSSAIAVGEQNSVPAIQDEPSAAETRPEETEAKAAYAAAASATSSAAVAEASTHTLPTPEVAPSEIVSPGEPQHHAELASAWASWKQVRDSVSSPEFTSQVADAAATGFKEIRHEEPASPQEPEAAAEDDGAIASIVDSVLAELKPKLMEEIAKKMKKEK